MTTTSVDEYLDTLQHPRRDDVLRVRAAVLAATVTTPEQLPGAYSAAGWP